MLFKNSVRTSKRTPHFTITKINWLTLFKFNEVLDTPGLSRCCVLQQKRHGSSKPTSLFFLSHWDEIFFPCVKKQLGGGASWPYRHSALLGPSPFGSPVIFLLSMYTEFLVSTLTLWNRTVLEKLTVTHLLKKLPALYGTQLIPVLSQLKPVRTQAHPTFYYRL
jgi:hypothetical protein